MKKILALLTAMVNKTKKPFTAPTRTRLFREMVEMGLVILHAPIHQGYKVTQAGMELLGLIKRAKKAKLEPIKEEK